MPAVAPGSAMGMLILAYQIVIGLAIGFALRLVFVAVEMAGDLIGLQMGLGFAMFYDPGNVQHTPILGQFLGLLATLIFLSINGHLLIISALVDSFHTLPITVEPMQGGFFQTLARHGAIIFAAGLQLALPLIVTMLVVNLSLGVLTRAAPQLNIFAVGFPVTLAIGFAALVLTLPYFAPVFQRLLDQGFRFVAGLGG
jgi:flagellar biosynthetic protein FliR